MKKKVLIGLSGGVDSSVAAYLLKKQGYDVIGITMRLCSEIDVSQDAKKIADKLKIPYYILDLRNKFNRVVIDYFANEYMNGRTPNPCAMCNKFIKFEEMLDKAKELGADYIATGHYAKIQEYNGRYIITAAEDERKDQTYMLYGLTQNILRHVLMPCGEYSKSEIREIAKEIGLEVHNKKDSMEICFIPDNDHGKYIKNFKKGKVKQGNFIDKNGKKIGKHKGIIYYTIGQRKGLGLALGKPAYVIDIRSKTNEVVIGDEDEIFKDTLIAKDVNFIPFTKLENSMEVEAKIRYSTSKSKATITILPDKRVKVKFKDKQRAITKGQCVVFYSQDLLIGGGIINEVI
ncbi:tRNA 2-thiouridine(34) synthase MnmA [Clostridium aestuarii]|uniref:tRNA-specific 2-thiouridylase MnmA n=1 Tax=Clostridium aestuarii TaxID=338193 RepID=A0ABT4CYY4_9CLOT|nr:tRNA 2-thiouridine(34) synthase MnmA [Clostridium aestuarii]MCY6484047.1 tRNA 2-thiouridine(34) synthase MnmA [Clostridium aestuarii]